MASQDRQFSNVASQDRSRPEARGVDLLLAALKDFAVCQGGVSSFSDPGLNHPFVFARPIGSLAVPLQLQSLRAC